MIECYVKNVAVECDDYQWKEYDARGYYLCKVCENCAHLKLSQYRRDVLEDPGYEADEPFEPEDF